MKYIILVLNLTFRGQNSSAKWLFFIHFATMNAANDAIRCVTGNTFSVDGYNFKNVQLGMSTRSGNVDDRG